MPQQRNRLSGAQLLKICDLIRKNETSLKSSKDIPAAIHHLANVSGITLVPRNLVLIQESLGVDWILPPKRKAPAAIDIQDLSSQYKELCNLTDELCSRLTKIEKAMQARGWRLNMPL